MLLGEETKFIWLGAIFIVVGIFTIAMGALEDRMYENALSRRFDLREFIERMPKWPQPHSLKIGGTIPIITGLVLIAVALFVHYR